MTKREGPFASSGRRQRPTSSSSSTSVPDAKAKFVASVSRGVACLMEEFGYSRERAQTALMLEITRGDNDNNNSPPADNEVFEVMSAHGLGMKDAANALTVSKALQRAGDVSMMEAIDDLTSKLSVANLLKIDRGAPSPVPTVDDEMLTKLIHPSVPSSIERVVTKTRHQQKTTIPTAAAADSSSVSAAPAVVSTRSKAKALLLSKNKQQKGGKPSSENSKEETTKSLSGKRERSDSLTEAVNAKFADKKGIILAEEEGSKKSSSVQSSSVVRSKRVRGEDAEATQNVMKRSRTAAADL